MATWVVHHLLLRVEERKRKRNNRLFRRELRDVADPYQLPEREFINLYRLRKTTARFITDSIRCHLARDGQRSDGIPAELKVLAALNFFAAGSYQRRTGGDYNANMSQTMVSIAIEEVVTGIERELLKSVVKFPQGPAEVRAVKEAFYSVAAFPGVIGAIDGTHVAIVKPYLNEHDYVNRKRYHSLNVMVVCDASMRITYINAKFPGGTHDSFVLGRSALKTHLENSHSQGGWLLGDSGYPLAPWLLTPLRNPVPGTAEARYTAAHCATRVKVENCFGLMKQRFRCLSKHRVLHYQPAKAGRIVNAVAVLHNLAITRNDPMPDNVDDEDFNEHEHEGPNDPNHGGTGTGNIHRAGEQTRAQLIRNHFQ